MVPPRGWIAGKIKLFSDTTEVETTTIAVVTIKETVPS